MVYQNMNSCVLLGVPETQGETMHVNFKFNITELFSGSV